MIGAGGLSGHRVGPHRLGQCLSQDADRATYAIDAAEEDLLVEILASTPQPAGAARAFVKEMEAAARIRHRHLVPVLAAGIDEGRVWIQRRRGRGRPLAETLTSGRMSLDDAARGGGQLFAALEALHEHGLVHRDLRPARLAVDEAGDLYLLPGAPAATELPTATPDDGSLAYRAPEVVAGSPAGTAADLYGGGAVLYEMLCGHRPFEASGPVSLLFEVLNDTVEPPSTYAPRVPAVLEQLLASLLAKTPDARPGSAAQVRQDLQSLSHRRELASLPTTAAGGDAAPPEEVHPYHDHAQPRFVGRREPLDTLLKTDGPQVRLVVGEAGIGKTRLLREVCDRAAAEGRWILSGAARYGSFLGPYMPILDAVSGLLGDDGPLSPDQRRALVDDFGATTLGDLLQSPTPSAKVRAAFAAEYGAGDDGEAPARLRFFDAVAALLTRIAALRPSILVVEDLHWADADTLALLRHLTSALEEEPIVILASLRPEDAADELAAFVTELTTSGAAVRCELPRLSRPQIAALARSLFADSAFTDELDECLFDHSRGNPFVALELVKLLRTRRILYCDHGLWLLRAGCTEALVPERVEALIRRRLDTLPRPARELLQLAAVLGDRFRATRIEPVAGTTRADLLRQLYRLEHEHRMLERQDDEYRFVHPMLREVLCRELPPELRREYHRMLAALLARDAETTPAAVLGHHHYEAGDYAGALPWLRTAADHAWQLYGWADAARLYAGVAHAAAETGADVEVQLHALLRGARACARRGMWDEARQRLGRMQQLARQHRRPLDDAAALHERGSLELQQARLERASDCFRQAVDTLATVGGAAARRPYARALTRWGAVDFERGAYDAAFARWQEARQALTDEDGTDLANVLNNLAVLATVRGEVAAAADLYGQVLALDAQADDPGRTALTECNLGMLCADQGDFDSALTHFDRGRQLCLRSHLTVPLPLLELNAGEAHLGRGDHTAARDCLNAALRGFRRLGDALGAADTLKWLGRLCREEGQLADSADLLRRSVDMNRQFGESVSLGEALYELGEVERLVGTPDAARTSLEEAERIFSAADARPDLDRTRTALEALTPT